MLYFYCYLHLFSIHAHYNNIITHTNIIILNRCRPFKMIVKKTIKEDIYSVNSPWFILLRDIFNDKCTTIQQDNSSSRQPWLERSKLSHNYQYFSVGFPSRVFSSLLLVIVHCTYLLIRFLQLTLTAKIGVTVNRCS